ncbi:unnamed protein product, partial [Mesorhabditis belari]|uniref:phospholipase A2 n=1 Tax=Mesorhabditis belari TaxID=2138241 RepID=A0AAF3FBN8_9BILA
MLKSSFLLLFTVHLIQTQNEIEEGSGLGEDPCPPKLDLAFVVDASVNNERIYQNYIEWMSKLADSLPIGQEAVRLTTIQYAGSPSVEFTLKEAESSSKVAKRLKNMTFQGGVTRTGYALRKTESELTRLDRGARPDAEKCIVLFTNGLSIDDPLKISEHLRVERKIQFYVVSVGKDGVFGEMERLVGSKENTFGPKDLSRLRKKLLKDVEESRICANGKKFEEIKEDLLVIEKEKSVSNRTVIALENLTKVKPQKSVVLEKKETKRLPISSIRGTGTVISSQLLTSSPSRGVNQVVGTQQIRLRNVRRVLRKKFLSLSAKAEPTEPTTTEFSPITTPHRQRKKARIIRTQKAFKRTTTTGKLIKKKLKEPLIFTKKWISTTAVPLGTIPTKNPIDLLEKTGQMNEKTGKRKPSATIKSSLKITKPMTTSRALVARSVLNSEASTCPVDLLFIVDSSGSIVSVYQKQKAFLLDLLSNIDVSQQAHRVALLQFSSRNIQKTELSFDEFKEKTELLNAFGRVRHITGTTYISAALESAKNLLISRRKEVETIVILLSDGYSQDNPMQTALDIQQLAKTEFYAASVAENNNNELLIEITGNPRNVFVGENVEQLKEKLIQRLNCRKLLKSVSQFISCFLFEFLRISVEMSFYGTSLVRKISDRFAAKERTNKFDLFNSQHANFVQIKIGDEKPNENALVKLEVYKPRLVKLETESFLILAARRKSAKRVRRFIVTKSEKLEEIYTLKAMLQPFIGVLKFVPRRTASIWIEKVITCVSQNPNWRPYHLAAFVGCTRYFKKRKAIFYNFPCAPDGWTPAMIAVKEGHFEPVVRLIDLKVELRTTDNQGLCVLDHIKDGDNHLLELLAESIPEDYILLWCSEHKSAKADFFRHFLSQGEFNNATVPQTSPLHDALTKTPTSPAKMGEVLSVFNFEFHASNFPNGGTWLHGVQNKRSLLSLLENKRLMESDLDTNARDCLGRTALMEHVLRGRHGFVLALYGYWTNVNIRDIEGNTALHYAIMNEDLEMVKVLICCGAWVDAKNHFGETPRHLAARTKKHSELIALLAMKWAAPCKENSQNCLYGCLNLNNKYVPYLAKSLLEETEIIDENGNKLSTNDPFTHRFTKHLATPDAGFDFHAHMLSLKTLCQKIEENRKREGIKMINALSLDGGGIRGLVITQLLSSVEELLDRPLPEYFEWIASTSTGAALGGSATIGLSIREGQRIYLRFKDDIFDSRVRPYDALVLEKFYKSVFGEERAVGETNGVNHFFCTTNDATTYPSQLMLIRNYDAMGDSREYGDINPNAVEMWRAVRRSSAAPTYFSASEQRYIDGGLSSNNPTMELLSEIHHWNMNCREEEKFQLGCVLSIGTGKTQPHPVDPSQIEMSTMFGMMKGMRNLFNMVMAQVTATDGAVVTRSRAWTQSLGAVYFRLSPMLSKEYQLDAKEDPDVIAMMWECVVYAFSNKALFEEIAEVLKKIGPAKTFAGENGHRKRSWSAAYQNLHHWRDRKEKTEKKENGIPNLNVANNQFEC